MTPFFCLNTRIPYFFFQLNKIPEDTRSMMSSATSRTTIDEKVLHVWTLCLIYQRLVIFFFSLWSKHFLKSVIVCILKQDDFVDVKTLQDKLKYAENKMAEYRNQTSLLKQELKMVHKVCRNQRCIADLINLLDLNRNNFLKISM